MPTSPRTPAAHHYIEAEQGLADIGKLGADEAERLVEVLTAVCHGVLAIAATLAAPAASQNYEAELPDTPEQQAPLPPTSQDYESRDFGQDY